MDENETEERINLGELLDALMPDPIRRKVSERLAGIAFLTHCVTVAAHWAREEEMDEEGIHNIIENASRSFEALGITAYELDMAMKMLNHMDESRDEMRWTPDESV